MASLLPATGDIQTRKPVFLPRETHDHPYDVTLVVEDGKEFKAHRRVLKEASPFFEKLLNSDMREAKEGVARLEMLTETGLGDILEFIYTGSVQISAEDNAPDLIAMADYLLLPQLKFLAEEVLVRNLVQMLNASNCLSIYFFAQRYQCEQLISDTTKFILANFSTVAKTEDFLNMSFEEVEKWISSDEIDINAEEDVFRIILTWIDCDKNERKKYFADLFRHVRLAYVSRDYLNSDIVTNDLVHETEGCLDRVTHTVMLIDSKQYDELSVTPRKSLETPILIACSQHLVLCYFLRKDTWCQLHGVTTPLCNVYFRHGKLNFTTNEKEHSLLWLDRSSNRWRSKRLEEVGSHSEEEIFALVSEKQASHPECVSWYPRGIINSYPLETSTNEKSTKKYILNLCNIMKRKPNSNIREDIRSFDLGVSRVGTCVVSKGNFIDFLGDGSLGGRCRPYTPISPSDAGGCEPSENTKAKPSDIQEERRECATAAHRKIVFIGGRYVDDRFFERAREVENKTTKKWHLIASLKSTSSCRGFMICTDAKLYVLWIGGDDRSTLEVECYDPETNKWDKKAGIPFPGNSVSADSLPTTVPTP